MSEIQVPAAGKTLQVIEQIRQNSPVSIQTLLASIDISRSSLYALLNTLKALGYIDQSERRGYYEAGPRLLAWSHSPAIAPQDLHTAFYQEIDSNPVDETAALVVAQDDHFIVLAHQQSSQRVRSVFENGQRIPAAQTAASGLFTNPVTTSIRESGFHLIEYAETTELALPICRNGLQPDAALLISAPRYRWQTKQLYASLPALRAICARLSYRLGAQVYTPFQQKMPDSIRSTTVMPQQDINSFLQGPWAARLACVRPDGTPHVVPVWHEWSGDSFFILAWPNSRWADFIQANPSISLTIDEPWPPLRRVSVRGQASLLDPDQLPGGRNSFLQRLFQRYLGHSLPANSPAWQSQAFHIQPSAINGWCGIINGSN